MIPDEFQIKLSALLKEYNKEIRVQVSPIIVDAAPTTPPLKGKKKA